MGNHQHFTQAQLKTACMLDILCSALRLEFSLKLSGIRSLLFVIFTNVPN